MGSRAVTSISFEPDDLAGHAKAIFAAGGPRAVRMQAPNGRSVVFVARHDDVTRVLKDEKTFSLAHYPALFGAIAPKGIELIMAPETQRLKRQREIFVEAAGRMANSAIADAMASRAGSTGNRRAVAKTAVRNLLDTFRARKKAEFDIGGEYAYFAPYLVGRDLFGLPGPARADVLVRILVAVRRMWGVSPRLTPETTPFLTATCLAQLAFAQVFRNFENRSFAIRWVARYGASAFARHIRARFKMALQGYDPYAWSLLSSLCQRGKAFEGADADAYADHAVSLLVEMYGTILLIPPLAFVGVVQWMVEQKGGIPAQLEHMNDENAPAFVDEFLRLSPPSKYLLRTATEGVMFDGFHVDKGDYVCALVAQACRDPNVFNDPDAFCLGRTPSTTLHFGPSGGPHQCLGREIGRDLLGEMLLGLKTLSGLWPQPSAKMKDVLGLQGMTVTWNREARMQRGYGPHRSSPEATVAPKVLEDVGEDDG